jgi:Asp-tRNA(Asn)/Glu-tRNA(Gln) amidotransferase A subunit family amidase
VKTLRDILLTGKVVPSRTNRLITNIGKTTSDPGNLSVIQRREDLRQAVLKMMADLRLDAIVHATFDHPAGLIPSQPLTIADPGGVGDLGNNRRLAPLIAFPALSVPAGFTAEGLPVGIEFLGRQFSEGRLLALGYAFEQATHHRRPPMTTPPLPGEP